MNRNRKFDYDLILDGSHIRAVGEVTPYYPATMMDPSDGGELECVNFFGADGKEIADPDDEILNILESDIYERLEKEDAGPDPDELNDMAKAGD